MITDSRLPHPQSHLYGQHVARFDQLLRVHNVPHMPPDPGQPCGREHLAYTTEVELVACQRPQYHAGACTHRGDPAPPPHTACGIPLESHEPWIAISDPEPADRCTRCALGVTGHQLAITHALTVHQPWAWLILHGGKDVENRTWSPNTAAVRNGIAIHAGATNDPFGHELAAALGVTCPAPDHLEYRAILGVVDVAGISSADRPVRELRDDVPVAVRRAQEHASPWADAGAVHWHLANPRPLLVPIPARGRQRLWKLGAAYSALLEDQLS